MDFIKKLLSFSEFNTVLIIFDQLTKYVIFIPIHNTIIFIKLVQLSILYVFLNMVFYLMLSLTIVLSGTVHKIDLEICRLVE